MAWHDLTRHRAWGEENGRRMSKIAELQGRLARAAGDTAGDGGTDGDDEEDEDEEEEEEEEEEDDDDDERAGSGGSGESALTVKDAIPSCVVTFNASFSAEI